LVQEVGAVTFLKTRAVVPALIGAALVAVPLAAPAAAAPVSNASPDPGASTTAFGTLDVFYATTNGTLVHQARPAGGPAGEENLGGALRTGPGAITIGSEFAGTWAFVTGGDDGVWFRVFSDGSGLWGPWRTIGGVSTAPPAASCTGDFTAQPTVYVTGGDGAVWRRNVAAGGWSSLGAQLLFGTSPAVIPAVGGVCPAQQDLFAVGTNLGLYERRATWVPIGGRSVFSPTVLQLPGGRTEVYLIGLNGALYTASRAPGSTVWSGFTRIGGLFESSPSAQLWQTGSGLRTVVGRGTDDRLWQATSPIGSTAWTFRAIT
jgi:hypothetical protein